MQYYSLKLLYISGKVDDLPRFFLSCVESVISILDEIKKLQQKILLQFRFFKMLFLEVVDHAHCKFVGNCESNLCCASAHSAVKKSSSGKHL